MVLTIVARHQGVMLPIIDEAATELRGDECTVAACAIAVSRQEGGNAQSSELGVRSAAAPVGLSASPPRDLVAAFQPSLTRDAHIPAQMTTNPVRTQVAAKWQESFVRVNRNHPGIVGLLGTSQVRLPTAARIATHVHRGA